MATVRLVQISEPGDDRHVLERPPDATEDLGPYMQGAGDLDLTCGSCEKLLAGGLDGSKQLIDLVFKCQACGAYSEPPT
jgi:hypothetical protein